MALMQLKEQRVRRRFVQLLLEDHDLYQDDWPWGGELIYRNGKFCGYTTSVAYGFSLEKQVINFKISGCLLSMKDFCVAEFSSISLEFT